MLLSKILIHPRPLGLQLEYDPPQIPMFFIRKAERTARYDQEGDAIVFLLPTEDTYIEFLKLGGVPLKGSVPRLL